MPPETGAPSTSLGLSRLTKPHDERENTHHRRVLFGFCPEGDSSPSIVKRQRLHRERHSARGRHLRIPVTAFRQSVSRIRLASKVTQSITSRGGSRNRKLIVCTAGRDKKSGSECVVEYLRPDDPFGTDERLQGVGYILLYTTTSSSLLFLSFMFFFF